MTPTETPRHDVRITRGILVILALTAANLLAWRSIEADLWGHIQYGEDWLSSGIMPRTATHTFTTPDHPWINHENLFELAAALGQRAAGGLGLMLGKCAAGLWLLLAMVQSARRKQVPLLAAGVAMVPVAWGLSEFWLVRPQLFSFIFFGLMILALERAFRDWDTENRVACRWLWLCVPLMIVWTNSHGGFAAGLCVLLAFCGLRSAELWLRVRWSCLLTVAHLFAIGCAAVLAVFVNPYGAELPYWMVISLSQPRPEVSEWANLLDSGVTAVPFSVLSLLTLLGLVVTRRRRDRVELIVLGLIAVQTLGHVRHLAFFAIAFGFWMPQHLLSVWHRLVEWRPTLGAPTVLTDRAARWLRLELGLVALVPAGMLVNSFTSFGVDRSQYPVAAFEFMAQENIRGRLVATFNWAQYALAALAPDTTVGFDGRYDTCYPQEVVDMHFDLLFTDDLSRRFRGNNSGPVDPNRVLEFGNPNLVLLDRIEDRPAVRFLESRVEWVPLYCDARAILWGRRTVFDDPDRPDFVAPERRRLTDDMPTGIAEWPGFPDRAGRNAFSPDFAAAVSRKRESPLHLTLQARNP